MTISYDAFISHSHKDVEWVAKLNTSLTNNGLITCFSPEISGGEDWSKKIDDAIEHSRAYIIILSPGALSSPWVELETSRAIITATGSVPRRNIVPVIYQACDIPKRLSVYQYIDFCNPDKFDANVDKLCKALKYAPPSEPAIIPGEADIPLDKIMGLAKHSLVVSGHTLDKFSQNGAVKIELVRLLDTGAKVTLILLNPYCLYSKAHEPYHRLESRASAKDEIASTIDFLKHLFHVHNHPVNLTVLLSNYMPRFRTILVDDEYCHVNLYMYGVDAGSSPKLVLKHNDPDVKSQWFQTVVESLKKMMYSQDVLPLIHNGRINEHWDHSRVSPAILQCLESGCCQNRSDCWKSYRDILLGVQNDNPQGVVEHGLCNDDYEPGTFTLAQIAESSSFLETPIAFDRWIDGVLRYNIELIRHHYPAYFDRIPEQLLIQQAKKIFEMKPINEANIRTNIWFQEYSDVVNRILYTLLTGNPDLDLNLYPELTLKRRDFIYSVISYLEREFKPTLANWLHLSIAAGLLGIDEKSAHAATSSINQSRKISLCREGKPVQQEIKRVSESLWDSANTPCRIDASQLFFHMLDTSRSHAVRIVSFPDDYLESIFLIKYYHELLKKYDHVSIDCVPRAIRCSNDASVEDIMEFCSHFGGDLLKKQRFQICEHGPVIGGVNIRKLHPRVVSLLERSFLIDVRGARSYEMMQGLRCNCFFGFMVCRDISESLTGLPAAQCPLIYIRQVGGEKSFQGFQERHRRVENGMRLARRTVLDEKQKWEGGQFSTFDTWPNDRRYRYNILTRFYSNNAQEFHYKFGDPHEIEVEVKEFLNTFKRGDRILVLGCGSGKEVQHLVSNGCHPIGIDFSAEAILLAREFHPNLKDLFFVEDFYNLDTFLSGDFNGIVANAALVHLLERDDMKVILEKMAGRLSSDGKCFLRVLQKDGYQEQVDDYQFGQERWFVYYTIEDLAELSASVGLRLNRSHQQTHSKYPGVYWNSVLLGINDSQ